MILLWSLDSSVIVMTVMRAGRPVCDSLQVRGFFSSPPRPDQLWGPSSLFYPVGAGCSFSGGKSESCAEVKNPWSYTSTHQYVFLVWYLVKHMNRFTSTITITY
jgi:hypothetical protein